MEIAGPVRWFDILACDKDTDGRAHSAELSAAIKDDLAVATPHNPLIVIKHHLYTNFTAYGLEEPTWINVAREPVSRFVSSYYFRRFGFARHEGVRNNRVKAGERAMEMVRFLYYSATLMLVTDIGDAICWWSVWDVRPILSPTSFIIDKLWNCQKYWVTNIA